MRVLQLVDTLDPGGAERVALNYANMLSNKLGKSYLATSRASGILLDELNDQVVYTNINKKNTFDLSAIRRLKRFMKLNEIKIVHAHTTSYFFAVLTKLIYPRIKVVWHDHQGNRDELKVMKQIPLILLSFFFSGVLVVNTRLEDWVKKYLLSKNVLYIENFISENSRRIGKTKLFGNDGKRIVSVANLKNPKNHLFLLKAFHEVHKKKGDWSLHLIGTDYKDSYSAQLKEYIKNHGLGDAVFIYGHKKDMDSILKQCSIGVISSSFEGLPMALIEYGYAGLSVITTDVGSCKQMIEGRGLVIESNNEAELIVAINKLVEDDNLRKGSANKIKKYIESGFTEKAILRKVTDFYETL